MVQIFEAPTGPMDAFLQLPKAAKSIAEGYQGYKQNKAINEAALSLAGGDEKLAPLYARAMREDPKGLMKMLQIQQIMGGGATPDDMGIGDMPMQQPMQPQQPRGGLMASASADLGQEGGAMPQQSPMPKAQQNAPKQAQRPKLPYDQKRIEAMQIVDPQRARNMQMANDSALAHYDRDRKSERGAFDSDRKYHSELSTPYLKKIDESRETLNVRKSALKSMKDSIREGDLSFVSPDSLANLTGIEGFRSSDGAKLITAGKEFFLGSISRVGARPNQFIEQQISNMMPMIGRSREANETVAELFQFETDIEEKRIELADSLSESFEEKLGYTPKNISALVDKEMKPYVEERQRELSDKLKNLHEQEKNPYKDYPLRKVKPGTELDGKTAEIIYLKANKNKEQAMRIARELGYKVD